MTENTVLPFKKETTSVIPSELRTSIQSSLNDTNGEMMKTIDNEINGYLVKKASSIGEIIAKKIMKWAGFEE